VFPQVIYCLEGLPSNIYQAPIFFASVTCVTQYKYILCLITLPVCLKNAAYDVQNHAVFSILLLPNQFTVTTVH